MSDEDFLLFKLYKILKKIERNEKEKFESIMLEVSFVVPRSLVLCPIFIEAIIGSRD